ncbi:MAG: metallophosphoesterase [Pseudomonadota bacterium]
MNRIFGVPILTKETTLFDRGQSMKVLYTVDLHVDPTHYQRLLDLEKNQKIDCLIIGGDLIPTGHGFYESTDFQREFIRGSLNPYFSKLKDAKPNLGIYLMMGNDDRAVNMDLLEDMEREGTINLLHKRHHVLKEGLHLVGYAYVPITPFALKDWERFDSRDKVAVINRSRRCFLSTMDGVRQIDLEEVLGKEKTIEEDMEYLPHLSDPRRTIYVMHAPPYNTALDTLFNGTHCGSNSIRRFIEKHHPYLTFHGHIHESPLVSGRFMEQIGETLCINPGQEEDRLHAVIFDTEDVKGTLQFFPSI